MSYHSESESEYNSDTDSQTEWDIVESYEDLLRLNIDFIQGKTSWTPYHAGALCVDSQALKNELTQLQHLGFFSHDGQGQINNKQRIVIPSSNGTGTTWRETQQICYIDFYCPQSASYDRFVDLLKQQSCLKWMVCSSDSMASETNLPPGRYIHTRHRDAQLKRDLPQVEWINDSGVYDADAPSLNQCFDYDTAARQVLEDLNPYCIHVSFANCRQTGLEKLLIQLVKQADVVNIIQ